MSGCLGFKFVPFIMSLKSRRLSLDSSVYLDNDGLLGGRRGSSIKLNRRSRKSCDFSRAEIPELSHHLSSRESIREKIQAEESFNQTDGLISKSSFQKHNKTFNKLFPEIPDTETTHTFACALQKEVIYHGKLFISENYVCFYSSVLLKDTKVVITASSVREVKKQNSALSMLSIQTSDGEKYSFVYLRNRELCYQLLQSICSLEPGDSTNSSPHLSSAEIELDHDVPSNYSSMEDSFHHPLSRQNSVCLTEDFPPLSGEGPTSCNTSSVTVEDQQTVPWFWRTIESIEPFVVFRETGNLSTLFYIYLLLVLMLLLVSGYIGLKIIALEEMLNTMGALVELSLAHTHGQET